MTGPSLPSWPAEGSRGQAVYFQSKPDQLCSGLTSSHCSSFTVDGENFQPSQHIGNEPITSPGQLTHFAGPTI